MIDKKKFETPQLTTDELSAELVLTNLKLAKAHERLLEEEKARSEMFSSISHDLRSPITAIKNAVELLQDMDSYDVTKVKPLLELMDGRIQSLEHLINDIFLLVSLDNHCKQLELQQIPLVFFLEDYFFSLETNTAFEHRRLSLDVPEDLIATVDIDPHQFTRVLDNLFTNALKYSKENDTISLCAEVSDDTVKVSVKDTGIGIAPEHIDKIFERCYIVEQARTPGVSSTGLGLAITRSIVTQLSGTIHCTSELGKGSTFTITLPLVDTPSTI